MVKKIFSFVFIFILLTSFVNTPKIMAVGAGGECGEEDICKATEKECTDDGKVAGPQGVCETGLICCLDTINENVGQPANVKITSLGSLISALISAVFIIAGLLCFVFLVWGGIQWITSGGDKAGVEAAQKKIQAAIIGLIIVFASWAIMKVLSDFLGINVFSLAFPKPF